MPRKILVSIVNVLAGFVYQRGVDLYRLSDWLDDDDETDLTESQFIEMWSVGEPTTTVNGTTRVTWTRSS